MNLSIDKRMEALQVLFATKAAESTGGTTTIETHVDADYEKISKMIGDALRVYNLDRTGRADYALESAGEPFYRILYSWFA